MTSALPKLAEALASIFAKPPATVTECAQRWAEALEPFLSGAAERLPLPTWSVADAEFDGAGSALGSISVTSDDLGRMAWLTDANAFYVLSGMSDGDGEWVRLMTGEPEYLTTQIAALEYTTEYLGQRKADLAFIDAPQAGSNWTLDSSAPKQLIRMTSSAANTITVPPSTTADIQLLAPCSVQRWGTGVTTIVAGAGVTLLPANNLRLANRYDLARLTRITGNTWTVKGEVTT